MKSIYRFDRIITFSIGHILSIFAIKHFYDIYSLSLLFQFILWHHLGAIGITAGAHRLWSHRSYKAKFPTRVLLMILNSISNQGHIIYWCKDHRLHHKYSDTLADPHSSLHGFFYCHIGWLFYRKPKEVKEVMNTINVDDLYEDKVVMFQYKLFPWWNLFWCFVFPTLYGKYMFNSYWTGFIIFGILRWVFLLHATWCVNSIAHLYGNRPYKDISPRQSFITSILAVGEGWHNYHHVYPYDYATAEYGFLYEWNPTKLFIDFLYIIGQVYDRKKVTNVKKFLKNN